MRNIIYTVIGYLVALFGVSAIAGWIFYWKYDYTPAWINYFIVWVIIFVICDIALAGVKWSFKLLCESWATGK